MGRSGSSSIVTRPPWSVAGLVAIGLLAAVTGCGSGPAPEDEHSELLGRIYAAYDEHFAREPTSFVLISYPSTVSALPAAKREELAMLRRVLRARGIPYECKPHAEVIVDVTQQRGTRKRTYKAYDVPRALAEKHRNGTLLFVNLDMHQYLSTAKHPVAVEYGIRVVVWNDPIEIPGDAVG